MKIRMKIAISGTFHGLVNGVQPGDVVDVDDGIGLRYCALHYATPVVHREEERAVAPKAEERGAAKPKPGPRIP